MTLNGWSYTGQDAIICFIQNAPWIPDGSQNYVKCKEGYSMNNTKVAQTFVAYAN